MSFFVKAVVAGLKKYPIVNASVDGEDIVYHGYLMWEWPLEAPEA